MPDQLAYGLRKQVALARALASQPRLLPRRAAYGLSETEIDGLGELISSLSAKCLLVEHRMDLVMAVCDTVVVLTGRVIARARRTRCRPARRSPPPISGWRTR
jgi:branched-chain amino acid transport system ATP-binding protein